MAITTNTAALTRLGDAIVDLHTIHEKVLECINYLNDNDVLTREELANIRMRELDRFNSELYNASCLYYVRATEATEVYKEDD